MKLASVVTLLLVAVVTGQTARSVVQVVSSRQMREGGGFVVRRPLGGHELPILDPFLMVDHMGPVEYGPGEAIGAPDHPHRGYLIEGSMEHKDSVGNKGYLGPGWVQWMTAGSGVIHSEMPGSDLMKTGGKMEGFQIWVNLKSKDKDTPPEVMPIVDDGNLQVKVIAGSYKSSKSPIETRYPITLLDVVASGPSTFSIPVADHHNAAVYVYRGAATVGRDQRMLSMGQLAVLQHGDSVDVASEGAYRALVLTGEPLNEPVVKHGPFVMNTDAEIRKAISDYQRGQFGEIDGAAERRKETEASRAKQKESGRWSEL